MADPFADLIPNAKTGADLFTDLVPKKAARGIREMSAAKPDGSSIFAADLRSAKPGQLIRQPDGSVYLVDPDGRKASPISRDDAAALIRQNSERRAVEIETADSPALRTAMDAATSFNRGLPLIGGFMDRAGAGIDAMTGGGSYDEALAQRRARAAAFADENPVIDTGLQIAGGITGTLAAAPAAGAGAGSYLLGTGGKTFGNNLARGITAGLAQGGAYGAGQSEDLTDLQQVATDTGTGSLLGGAIGAAAPLLMGGAGRVMEALANRSDDALSAVPSKARQWLLQQTKRLPASQADDMAALGPDAMLADVDPTFRGVARAAAARPDTKALVVDALAERDAGKQARLANVIRSEIGDAPIPSDVEAAIDMQRKAIGPAYDAAFEGARAVDAAPILDQIDSMIPNVRGAAGEKLRTVRGYLMIPGTDQLDPSPQAMLQTRNAVDGMMRGEMDNNVLRNLEAVRDLIDGELAAKVPSIKAIDSQYADTFRQDKAFKAGREVFDSDRGTMVPQEVERAMVDGVLPTGSMIGPSGTAFQMRQGARAEIERIVGSNANDVTALNRLLRGEGDWNRAKMASIFGKDKAERILKVLDAEVRFQQTAQRVMGGSDTGETRAFTQFLDETASGPPQIDPSTSLFGGTLRLGQKALGSVLRANGEATADQFAADLARLSVAKGQEANAIIAALMQRADRAGLPIRAAGYGAQAIPGLLPVIDALRARPDTRTGTAQPGTRG